MGWRAKEMLLVFINIYGMEKEGGHVGAIEQVKGLKSFLKT